MLDVVYFILTVLLVGSLIWGYFAAIRIIRQIRTSSMISNEDIKTSIFYIGLSMWLTGFAGFTMVSIDKFVLSPSSTKSLVTIVLEQIFIILFCSTIYALLGLLGLLIVIVVQKHRYNR